MTSAPTPVLLSYNLNDQRGRWVDQAAERLGFVHRPVQPTAYGLPLLALVEGTGTAAAQHDGAATVEAEMLVLAFFPPNMINAFLDAFRQEGMPSVRLKAMLTETNSQWDSLHLYQELQQEAAHFARLRQLAQQKNETASEEAGEGPHG